MTSRNSRRPSIEPLESRSLLTAGSLETTFGVGGYVTNPGSPASSPIPAAVQPWDGKILQVGNGGVYRYNTDGTLDTTFGVGGVAPGGGLQIVPDPTSCKIYLVGNKKVKDLNDALSWIDYAVTRLNKDGSVDPTFGNGGSITVAVGTKNWDTPQAAAIDGQGRLVVVGSSASFKNGFYPSQDTILRFTASGQLDPTFGSDGEVNSTFNASMYDGWNALLINSRDSSITVTGADRSTVKGDNSSQNVIATYNSSGALTSRNLIRTPVAPYDPTQLLPQGTAAFLPGGDLVTSSNQLLTGAPNGDTVVAVARYTPTGLLDTSFGNGGVEVTDLTTNLGYPSGSPSYGGTSSLTIDPSGRVVLGGVFSPISVVNGKSTFGDFQQLLVRYTSSGGLDTSFGNGGMSLTSLGSNFASAITNLIAEPDGNILAFGWVDASSYNESGSTTAIALYQGNSSPSVVVTQEPPASVTAGTPFGLTVEAEDSSGKLLSSYTGTIRLAMANNPGGATLGGSLTATAINGVATFSGLTLTRAATGYTFQVSGDGLDTSDTGGLTVTPGAAASLLIASEPTSVSVKTSFSLVIEVLDTYGNVVTSDNNTVTIAIGNGPSKSKLGGTTSASFVNGVATFSGLTLNKVGAYTILISAEDFTDSFNVTAS